MRPAAKGKYIIGVHHGRPVKACSTIFPVHVLCCCGCCHRRCSIYCVESSCADVRTGVYWEGKDDVYVHLIRWWTAGEGDAIAARGLLEHMSGTNVDATDKHNYTVSVKLICACGNSSTSYYCGRVNVVGG